VAVLAGVAVLVALVGALRMLGLLYVQVTLVIARIVAAPEGYGHSTSIWRKTPSSSSRSWRG
jgi:hypothetical protein